MLQNFGHVILIMGAGLAAYAIVNDVARYGRRAWQVLKGARYYD